MNDGRRICWVVTGAGHFLREVTEFLEGDCNTRPVDLFFTRAAREVVARYALRERLENAADRFYHENDYSAGPSIYFSSGRYGLLVIAPATSNTVAKCAMGIADSLASNFFAQAGKCGVPIIVLPTDGEREVVSVTPSGREIKIIPRPIDLKWTEELKDGDRFPGVSVALSISDLKSLFALHISSSERI